MGFRGRAVDAGTVYGSVSVYILPPMIWGSHSRYYAVELLTRGV